MIRVIIRRVVLFSMGVLPPLLDKGNDHELGARLLRSSGGDRRPYPSLQLEGCRNWAHIQVHSKWDGRSSYSDPGERVSCGWLRGYQWNRLLYAFIMYYILFLPKKEHPL